MLKLKKKYIASLTFFASLTIASLTIASLTITSLTITSLTIASLFIASLTIASLTLVKTHIYTKVRLANIASLSFRASLCQSYFSRIEADTGLDLCEVACY